MWGRFAEGILSNLSFAFRGRHRPAMEIGTVILKHVERDAYDQWAALTAGQASESLSGFRISTIKLAVPSELCPAQF